MAAVGPKRRANKKEAIFADAIPIARGALDRLPRFAAAPELQDLVATGPALLAQLTAYVHGDVERKDVDGDAMDDWHRRWADRYKRDLDGDGRVEGPQPVRGLAHGLAGERAQATVIDVRDTGVTVNEDPRVVLRVEPAGARHSRQGASSWSPA